MPRARQFSGRVGCLFVLALLAVGCTSEPPVRVPANAKLLYYGYGPANLSVPPEAGQVYIYDESERRVGMVFYKPAEQSFHANGLKTNRRYRIYLAPETDMATTQSAAP